MGALSWLFAHHGAHKFGAVNWGKGSACSLWMTLILTAIPTRPRYPAYRGALRGEQRHTHTHTVEWMGLNRLHFMSPFPRSWKTCISTFFDIVFQEDFDREKHRFMSLHFMFFADSQIERFSNGFRVGEASVPDTTMARIRKKNLHFMFSPRANTLEICFRKHLFSRLPKTWNAGSGTDASPTLNPFEKSAQKRWNAARNGERDHICSRS